MDRLLLLRALRGELASAAVVGDESTLSFPFQSAPCESFCGLMKVTGAYIEVGDVQYPHGRGSDIDHTVLILQCAFDL